MFEISLNKFLVYLYFLRFLKFFSFSLQKYRLKHHQGLLTEYYIRPPVDVTLEFVVPIDISHIIIHSSVNSHVTSGFSIFTEKIDINETNVAGNLSLGVGKFFTNGEKKLVLKNSYYKHWLKIPIAVVPSSKSKFNESNQVSDSIFYSSLKHSDHRALKDVKKIIVKMTRTLRTGPVALGHIEVWGQPAISTPSEKKQKVLQMWCCRDKKQKDTSIVPRIYQSEEDELPSVDLSVTSDIPVSSKDGKPYIILKSKSKINASEPN